jgi:hypothetical protein
MKTAEQYLFDVMGCDPVGSRIDYRDALEAVQAAIDAAGTIREQVRQGLADYFEDVLPLPPLPPNTPPIRLGQTILNALPCARCGRPSGTCQCDQAPF